MNQTTQSKSLQWQIFVRIAPAATLALLIVIVLSGFRVSQTLDREIERRVEAAAVHAASQTDLQLDLVAEACQSVAINDMVVTGIVDLEHRNTSLQSYFRSLKLPGPRSQQVTMTDYKGRVLASTTPNTNTYGSESWFPDVMSGERYLGVVEHVLTVACPVLYSNRAEGTVVATFVFDDLLADQAAVSEVNALAFHRLGSVVYSTELDVVSSSGEFAPSADWLVATAEVDRLANLQVSFLESKAAAFQATRTVRYSQLIQLAILVVGLLFTIWLASRLATKPLEGLLEQIGLIQNTRDLSLRVHGAGPREFVELGRGFNAMLSEVQRTTVSQEEYRLSEERLATAVQGTNDGLWDWDIESGDIWFAPGYKRLLGYNDSDSEFPNTLKSFEEHLHPDDGKATWEAIANHIENDAVFDIEQRIRTKQGRYKWFRARAKGVKDEAGTVARMAGSIQDISERKAFEQALQQSNKDLEQFAYIASHDLQEPLRKVASFCGLLREEYWERFDEDGRKYLDFAVGGATRMRSLIQDLLMYSRIGSDKNRSQQIDSEAALQDAIIALDSAIAESDAQITHDPLPNVIAEEREIAQLFQNLIGNALKYRSKATPEIHIHAVVSGESWQFSVADNGIGVEPEYRERIFGIFKRLHTREEYSGTGIGLAICKRIIDQLGGRIWAEPTPGQGCTICFTIPKKRSALFNHPNHTNQNQSEGSTNEHVSVKRRD